MGDILFSSLMSLAKQAPGILGIIVVVILAMASMRYQASATAEAVRVQAAVTAEAVRVQTIELKTTIERNTDAFLRAHEHYEAIQRLLEGRK